MNPPSLQHPESCSEISYEFVKKNKIYRRIPFYPEDTRDLYLFKPKYESKLTVTPINKIIQRPTLVSIEGNIGAGKSSFMKILQEKYKDRTDIVFIQEPVDMWETVKDSKDGQNILQKYYQNPVKYAFAFQVLAFTTRLQLIKRAIHEASSDCKVILMERSLDADHRIFAKMLLDDNILEPIEFQIYEMMANEDLREYSVNKILWLNTSAEECMTRIRVRGRVGEENISNEYLQKCDACHREWLGVDTWGVFILNEEDQSEIMNSSIHSKSDDVKTAFDKIEMYLCLY
jgi:deoxyadenosine/deoxycytidine kinase